MELKFVNKSNNPNPSFANVGDSGFDLRAYITDGNVTLKPMERRLIHTGLYFDIPDGCEIQVRPRSGTALKYGVTVINTPGTVDKNYTNEVGVVLVNFSTEDFVINNGDRIAQAVLMPVFNSTNVTLTQTDSIAENDYRNKNGFGSSGMK